MLPITFSRGSAADNARKQSHPTGKHPTRQHGEGALLENGTVVQFLDNEFFRRSAMRRTVVLMAIMSLQPKESKSETATGTNAGAAGSMADRCKRCEAQNL